MASESADTRREGNQDGAVRAAVAPFVERLIGTIRRECLDRTLFWTAADLETKLLDFQRFYNAARSHASLDGRMPLTFTDNRQVAPADLSWVRWVSYCHDLVQLPIAA